MAHKDGGFTVTEVMMFLAISGMLLTGALVAVNANINNSRFNDAVRSTASHVQQQYDEVSSGRNDRKEGKTCDTGPSPSDVTPVITDTTPTDPARTPGKTNCMLLGRFIKFEGDTLTTRYIVGHRDTLAGVTGDDTQAINQLSPVVAPGDDAYGSTFDVPWRISIDGTKIPSGTPDSLGLAIMRSPTTGNIVLYTFNANSTVEPDLSTVITSANRNQKAIICFGDGSYRRGNVLIGAGQGQELIQVDFSQSLEACT